MKMILVKSIEVDVVPQELVKIPLDHELKDPQLIETETKLLTERITGRKFINTRGQQFCIGMTKAVQESIGLPFEVFDILRHESESNKKIAQSVQRDLIRIRNAGFWLRLKFLFTGEM